MTRNQAEKLIDLMMRVANIHQLFITGDLSHDNFKLLKEQFIRELEEEFKNDNA